MRVPVLIRLVMYMVIGGLCWVPAAKSSTADNTELETTVRALVQANAEKDLPAMSKLMAHDADIISYSIGGRKYVGWSNLERDIKEEFEKVAALDLPISELKVWSKGDIGWYTMELDYVRVLGQGPGQERAVLPLRETGVLERRNGQWILLFTPGPPGLTAEPLVNLSDHDYRLEPNVTFTPDGRWIVFRSNMHGVSHVYAVELGKRPSALAR